MKIEFNKLPTNISFKIYLLLNHRRALRNILGASLGTAAIAGLSVYVTIKSTPPQFQLWKHFIAALSPVGIFLSVATVGMLKHHAQQFKKEHFEIYEALKNSQNTKPEVFLKNNNFIYVDRKGNLVGSKTKMQIGRMQLGRKRIVSPLHHATDETSMQKWLASFPKTTRRKKRVARK